MFPLLGIDFSFLLHPKLKFNPDLSLVLNQSFWKVGFVLGVVFIVFFDPVTCKTIKVFVFSPLNLKKHDEV